MALQKTSVFVPFGGALDSQKAPLSMPSTSLLTCDNVTQERRGEFRRRYGFTQVAGDSLAGINASCPSQVATVGQGPTGQSMVALMDTNQLVKFDTITGTWTAQTPLTPRVSTITRAPLAMTNDMAARLCGFASDGSEFVCSANRTTGPLAGANPSIYAVWGKVANPTLDSTTTLLGTVATINVVKCAALPGFLCIFWADTSGNLKVRVRTSSTGSISAATTVKTGLDAATPLLDAMYYTGSTITLVMRLSGAPTAFQRIEFNPSTLVNAADDTISSGITTTPTLIALIPDPSASTFRFIATANATNTTLTRMGSGSGTIPSNQWTLEALTATQITGCMKGQNDGAFIYNTGTALKRQTIVGGASGTARFVDNTIVGIAGTLASNGWGVSGDTMWYFAVVQNKSSTTDFQQTAVIQANTFTDAGASSSDNILMPVASVAPLGSGPTPTTALYQAMNTGTRTFALGMPVATSFGLTAGTVSADYVFSAFTQVLTTASDTAVNLGWPAYRNGRPILPGESLCTVEGSLLLPIGVLSPTQQPTLIQSAGGALTLLATYQYAAVLETVTQDGLLWRGPASVSTLITLTGGNQTVAVTVPAWQTESFYQFLRIKFFRSQANGSVPTLFKVLYADGASMAAGSWGTTDANADTAITAGEILYTVGEQQNTCWPPSSHVWIFDDRLWAVNRDYRTEVQYSKNLDATRQPETTLANVVDLDDQWGDVTGGSSVEGRGVIFKRNAIYFVQGEGLTNAGSGQNYTVTRISDDIGALPGTPLINAGDAIYFVSQRGIHSVDAAGNIRFVGKGIDAWVNQPQVNTPETFYDGIFVPSKNEVRFVTTNYVFVYDRKFPDQDGIGQWIRWTGLSGMRRCLLVNGQMVLFKTDGTVWREGTSAQTTDQGAAFTGVVRTGWIRYNPAGALVPAPVQGPMRVYDGRVVFTRIAGGGSITAAAKLYFNDDDSSVQSFTSQAIAGATLTDVGEFFPTTQKCTSCSVEVNLPSGDATMRIQGVSLNIGVRQPSEQRRPAGEKWS